LDDPLEEVSEDLETVAVPDLGEGRVVGQRLAKVVADVPSQGEAVGYHLHELPLASQVLEEKHKL
jgi:hypothetical protein